MNPNYEKIIKLVGYNGLNNYLTKRSPANNCFNLIEDIIYNKSEKIVYELITTYIHKIKTFSNINIKNVISALLCCGYIDSLQYLFYNCNLNKKIIQWIFEYEDDDGVDDCLIIQLYNKYGLCCINTNIKHIKKLNSSLHSKLCYNSSYFITNVGILLQPYSNTEHDDTNNYFMNIYFSFGFYQI